MNVAGLGVADAEVMIASVAVGAIAQFAMQREDVVHEAVLEFLHIGLALLAAHEFLPRRKQILDRDDILVCVWTWLPTHRQTLPPPRGFVQPRLLPVLERVKNTYLTWHTYHSTLPKIHQYTVGARIDMLFIEIIEMISAAAFLPRTEKLPYLRAAIRKLDTVKLLCLILWEGKSFDTKKYAALSVQLDQIGKMLGGWNGQLAKQNSPVAREK